VLGPGQRSTIKRTLLDLRRGGILVENDIWGGGLEWWRMTGMNTILELCMERGVGFRPPSLELFRYERMNFSPISVLGQLSPFSSKLLLPMVMW
jgi:hypothetical protein